MHIEQTRVMSGDRILQAVPSGTAFRVVIRVDGISASRLERSGYRSKFVVGDSFLPTVVGPRTRFNAHGRYHLRRNLPLESRYINTIEWTYEQWNGKGPKQTITEFKDIYRDCYQRDFEAPPAEELIVVSTGVDLLLVSRELTPGTDSSDQIGHIVNVFLELFGSCEIRMADLAHLLTTPHVRRVNWTMLPPGSHPWPMVERLLKEVLNDRAPRTLNPILARQRKIESKNPAEIYAGNGGFHGYMAYVFPVKGVAILECVKFGNATYVFDMNWPTASQLSKAEVISGGLYRDRIIHSDGWDAKIDAI
ncbi:hypothetical protein [Geothrix fermentans]|uniref:hypothetical protein n=1 Tax=Geothrix fermentans TaxID=44676 RepID=UPI0012FB6707|nr:hypothetical protein [Geothrix fermentans]